MPVSVLMPNQRPEPRQKEEIDPMDKILKGLQIASSVYGLKDAYDKGQMLKEDRELAKQKLSLEQKKAEDEGLTLLPKDLLSYGDKYSVADKEAPGSMKFMLKELGGTTRDIYLIPKKKEVDPLLTELTRARIDKLKTESAPGGIEKLAPEIQASANTLATKNANKIAIKNQIDSFMGSWDKLSEDQKIVQGRQLLKTLNSTEGADAIGTEEAKRLGGLLEYQMFNITQPGPMFGRDLEEFKTQAMDTSASIGKAIETNRNAIEQMTGRKQSYQGRELPQQQLQVGRQMNVTGGGLADLIQPKANAGPVGKKPAWAK